MVLDTLFRLFNLFCVVQKSKSAALVQVLNKLQKKLFNSTVCGREFKMK